MEELEKIFLRVWFLKKVFFKIFFKKYTQGGSEEGPVTGSFSVAQAVTSCLWNAYS